MKTAGSNGVNVCLFDISRTRNVADSFLGLEYQRGVCKVVGFLEQIPRTSASPDNWHRIAVATND